MIYHSKRFITTKKLLNINKIYNLSEALLLLKTLPLRKFDETIECHFNLNLKKKLNSKIELNLTLPYSITKKKTICVLSNELLSITDTNIKIVTIEQLTELINLNVFNFDILITTPNYMPQLVKFGRILGPRNLMPSLKTGTITTNILDTINSFNTGKEIYKFDKTGILHIGFGKLSFSLIMLIENFNTILINLKKLSILKDYKLKSCYICSTMSSSLKINII